MTKTSFAKPGSAATASEPVPVNVTPAVEPTPPVEANQPSIAVVAQPPAPVATFSDSDDAITGDDMSLPRITLVQNVGELQKSFPRGAFVLNQQTILFQLEEKRGEQLIAAATKPFRAVIVGFKPTCYTEKVQGGALGRQVQTVEDVIKAGGTVSYDEAKATKQPYFEQTETALLLIERPDHLKNDVTSFSIPADDKFFAVALYTMKGTSFTHAAKHFFRERKIGALSKIAGKSYLDGVWEISAIPKTYNGNNYFQPVVRLAGYTTPAIKELGLAVRG